jgi:hypothetical protein
MVKEALNLAYPSLDLILLYAALVGSFVLLIRKAPKSWLILCLALVLDVVWYRMVDLTASLGVYIGNWSGLIEVWMYLLFALAFFVRRKEP